MKSLSNEYIHSLSIEFASKVAKTLYLLDGSEHECTDMIKQTSGNEVRIYVNFNSDIVGSISNVRLIDGSDQVLAAHADEYIKSSGSPLIIAFIYQFEEIEGGKLYV